MCACFDCIAKIFLRALIGHYIETSRLLDTDTFHIIHCCFHLCFQDRMLTVTEEPAGNGRPGILHFQSHPTITKTIQWDAVLSSSVLYVEIPLDPLPEGSKER